MMTSLDGMRREIRERFERFERFERLKKAGSNPGSPELQNCINIRLTEEEDIEMSFKDLPRCRAVKEDYREILKAALVGGETVYKTLREG